MWFMANMYLLLRNGRQAGPFTIGELLQQQLRTSDMIWIEGKSTAWCYLSEMELSPVVTEKISDQSQVITSSGNEDEIERKAEELRKRALAFTPQRDYAKRDASSRPIIRQVEKNEEEVFHFVDHRKNRKSATQDVLMSLIIIGIFAASIYGGQSYFNNKQNIVPVAHKMESVDNHTAISKPAPVINKPAETVLMQDQDTTTVQETGITGAENDIAITGRPKASTSKVAKKKVQDTILKTEPVVIKDEEIVLPPTVNDEDLAKKETPLTEPKDTTAQVEKKKKGFRLFRKKNKKDDTEK
jgi:hypothetical protein